MADTNQNKQIIQNFIQVVWREQNLAALPNFWTTDCINYAMPGTDNRGLEALRTYHEAFLVDLSAFSDFQIAISQQVAEGDRVVTYMLSQGEHSGPFYGLLPTGKRIALAAMRIDRLQNGKIAEHWSVSDGASLMQQLQS